MSKNSRQTEVSVLDITALTGSFTLISRYLNKACESGLFNMDKAYELKLACNDIIKGINTLNAFQQFYINQTNEKAKQRVVSLEQAMINRSRHIKESQNLVVQQKTQPEIQEIKTL